MRPAKVFVATAALAALALFIFTAGCILSSAAPSPLPNSIEPAANLTSNATGTENKTSEPEAPRVTNTCWTGDAPCPDGSSTRGTWCTSGYSNVPACNTSYMGDTTGVPEKLLPITNFKCYWDIRERYKFGPFYDPAEMCAAKIAGWGESCTCWDFIQNFSIAANAR